MSSYENEGVNKSKYKRWLSRTVDILLISTILFILFASVPLDDYSYSEYEFERVQLDILKFKNALDLFKLNNNSYPTTDQGLKALVKNPNLEQYPNHKPHIQSLPLDPWGKDYQYLSPGVHGDFDIYSLGPDGVQSNDDFGSWEIESRNN